MKLKRIIHGVLLVLGLSVLGLLFYYAMWLITDEDFREMLKYGWPWNSWMVLVDYVACCLFTTVVTLYYWRSREKAERERDKFRLQALENQLSPHFVFNNFSILADLIEVDPKRASSYLMDLSKVYRYTLSHLDHETVTLQEELAFLDRYLALLKQRFGDGIQVRIADELAHLQGKLPPAALQMLIENAIKHNEHTQTRPLVIDMTAEGQRISVSNKKQPITNAESTSVGQHNIMERYRLLTSKKVAISNTQDEYRVSIPLIPIER
ncbi:MAG: sensor histidine kinase [Prevotella sp.]|jgi:LytS/YehU family sensor histidine kinase|nr:sensor histidine kinase [Prevotella sp.]